MSARVMMLAVLMAAEANAAGLVLDGRRVPGGPALAAQLAAARAEDPQAFEQVAQLVAAADAVDAKKRGGKVAPMGRSFKQLGAEALWPMLEVLAFEAGSGAPVTEGGRLSLAVGLLEAVGVLQDARAAGLLQALVELETAHPVVTRAAADAYGLLQTDAAAAKLVEQAQGTGAHARAVREGMGSCRRVTVAKALGAALSTATEVREQVELARALGDVGNAWAWRTPGVKERGEETEVRLTAARALLAAYLRLGGDARQAASNALLVVDSRDTPALITAAVARADAAQRTALAALQARLERNPIR